MPTLIPIRVARGGLRVSVAAPQLLAMLLVVMAADNVLLLRFLGFSWALVGPLMLLCCGGLALLVGKQSEDAGATVGLPTLACCLLIAMALLMLGGEGRFFYANTDWQVRDAVLADMARHPWPTSYLLHGATALLRAPIGMYLAPALVGGTSQAGLDLALLSCNAIVFALLLALGATLFQGGRARVIALTVFVLFSGWDIVGTAVTWSLGADPGFDHLERWLSGQQYSSNITLLFWVPHHAFAGWLCALAYLLWQQGRIRIGVFVAVVPLAAIWSPLAIMGAVPFAAIAAVKMLRTRSLQARDLCLGALAIVIALPALLYLGADALAVPSGVNPVPLPLYLLEMLLEVAPFALPVFLGRRVMRFGADTFVVVLVCLLAMPLWHIGVGSDFQMRASIMPLAILALMTADVLSAADVPDRLKTGVWAALIIGSLTGIAEIRRAVTTQASPPPLCSLVEVWNRQTDFPVFVPYASYLAPAGSLPEALRPVTIDPITQHAPASCWNRPWNRDEGPQPQR